MSEDVKEEKVEASTTTAAEEAKTETVETVEAKSTEDLVEAETLFEQKDIPYKVFKERNAKLRDTEKELKKLKGEFDTRVQDELYKREMDLRRDYESKLLAQQPKTAQGDDYSYDDYTVDKSKEDPKVKEMSETIGKLQERLDTLSTNSEQEKIRRTVETLRHEFPALDEEHVFAIKRARPQWNWEDCAEYSHDHFSKHLEGRWKHLVEQKKAASKAKVIGGEGLRNLKPEEKPKNWNDARKRVSDFIGND